MCDNDNEEDTDAADGWWLNWPLRSQYTCHGCWSSVCLCVSDNTVPQTAVTADTVLRAPSGGSAAPQVTQQPVTSLYVSRDQCVGDDTDTHQMSLVSAPVVRRGVSTETRHRPVTVAGSLVTLHHHRQQDAVLSSQSDAAAAARGSGNVQRSHSFTNTSTSHQLQPPLTHNTGHCSVIIAIVACC